LATTGRLLALRKGTPVIVLLWRRQVTWLEDNQDD